MNKFNLAKFKAGQLAITRDGDEARFIGICEDCEDYEKLVVKLKEDTYATGYSLEGTCRKTGSSSNYDLVRMKCQFDDWQKDDAIEITKEGVSNAVLHFHTVDEDGTLLFYKHGQTSYTTFLLGNNADDFLHYNPYTFSYKRVCSFNKKEIEE